MSENNNIPENVIHALYELIESSAIEIDDKTEKRLESDIVDAVSIHNLELSSLIQTVSVDALVELLIQKDIITKDEYENAMHLKLLANADLVKNFALRAASLKSIIYPDGKMSTNDTEEDPTN